MKIFKIDSIFFHIFLYNKRLLLISHPFHFFTSDFHFFLNLLDTTVVTRASYLISLRCYVTNTLQYNYVFA